MIAQENGSMARGGAKVVAPSSAVDHRRYPNPDQPPRQRPALNSCVVRMFNKVQVVYYLTRNGHLEHPHYLEVSHLATQPLRLKDVIDRLTVLRGKAMPCQYSWSCKRSYKNGFVWNDLSENDTIYASEGSEYVLKGSEIIHHTHFSGEIKEGLQIKGRHQRQSSSSSYVKPEMNEMGMNKSSGGERHSFSFTQANTDNNNNDEEDEEEEEEKGSWKSSFSLPSTSSTNSSDKQQQQQQLQPPPPPPPPLTPPKQITKPPISTVENEEGDRQLSRNTVLLQLIACGGGSVVAKAKSKPNNANKKFNFNGAMRSSNIIPCLKQQLSTRGESGSVAAISRAARPSSVDNNDRVVVLSKEVQEDDEDMLMVRFMSENPRFGNLQSEEKEYFSGTIVEAMTTHSLQHGQGQPQPAVLTKSSSYNEQRSCRAGLQAAAGVDEDEEKEVVEVKGMISKCIPRTKSCLSNSSKSTNKC